MTQDPTLPKWFPLETPRLRLRPFVHADLEAIHAYASDPQVSQFMGWGPNDSAGTEAFLGGLLKDQETWPRPTIQLALERLAAPGVIGSVRLGADPRRAGVADFGYVLHADFWRQGYVVEAMTAVIDVAFGPLGLHRLQATCDVRNRGSWRVMEKLGMNREGTLRQADLSHDGWRDTYIYGLLAAEWSR